MNELDHKEILELIKTLPPQIQEVINTSNWAEKLSVISKKHGLMLDQMTQLENLVFLIMLGVINPKKIMEEMIEIGIKKEQINSLISEIDSEIFQKIKDVLISNFEKEEDQLLTPTYNKNSHPDRETLLKEIEDKDENELMIPSKPRAPSTQVNTNEQNQKIIQQDLTKKSEVNQSQYRDWEDRKSVV